MGRQRRHGALLPGPGAATRDGAERPELTLRRAAPALAGCCAAAGLLWPGNGYNLAWGMQSCFFMVPVFGLAALALLLRRTVPSPAQAAGAAALAACALVTVGTGLAAVTALALLLPVLRLPRRIWLPLLAALVLLLFAALSVGGLGAGVAAKSPWRWLDDPLPLLDYLRRYLGEPARLALAPLLPPYQTFLATQILLAGGLLALVAGWSRLLWFRARPTRLAAQGHFLCLMAIGSALATGLARLEDNVNQAASIRYLTTGLLFWIGLLLLALAAARALRPLPRGAVLFGLLLVQIVLLAGLPRYWSDMQARHGEALQATAALLGAPVEPEALRRLIRDPVRGGRFVTLLRDLPGGVFRRDEARWLGHPASDLGDEEAGCLMAVRWLPPRPTEAGNLALAGWPAAGAPVPEAVLLLDAEGRVAALTWPAAGIQRASRPGDDAVRDLGWELWVTPEQRAAGRLVALTSARLCALPWP